MQNIDSTEYKGKTILTKAIANMESTYWLGSYAVLATADDEPAWVSSMETVHDRGIDSGRFPTSEAAKAYALDMAKFFVDNMDT